MTKIEVDKAMLKVMLDEYWTVDNNPTCSMATVWFLKQIGFSERDIDEVVHEQFEGRDISKIIENIEDQMCYYQD